jgi:hypothetical protein
MGPITSYGPIRVPGAMIMGRQADAPPGPFAAAFGAGAIARGEAEGARQTGGSANGR